MIGLPLPPIKPPRIAGASLKTRFVARERARHGIAGDASVSGATP
jgi:hypothetical protein